MKQLFTRCLLVLLLVVPALASAQNGTQPITLEEIWTGRFFPAQSADYAWMKDDNYYSALTDNNTLLKYEVKSGKVVDTLARSFEFAINGNPLAISDYSFSQDERRVLLLTESKPIYRHSATHVCYVYDIAAKKLFKVFDGKPISNPTLSPDAQNIGFTYNNNLYYAELATGKVVQVTTDGAANRIINGSTDWVYEEEFSFPEGFYWAPDGKRIAFYRFDESEVPMFTMDYMRGQTYPVRYEFKYPKAGEKNSAVTIHVYDLASGKIQPMDVGAEKDQYIPRVRWTADPTKLAILRLNRHQNHLDFLVADAATGAHRIVFTEDTQTWLDVEEESLIFLPGGKEFLWKSDRDGFDHLYRYSLDGKLLGQVTKGNWEITSLYGYNAKTKMVYYQSTEGGSTERHLYGITLDGKKKVRLSTAPGMHNASFSSAMTYFIDRFSNTMTPTQTGLYDNAGKQIRVLEDNAKLRERLTGYRFVPKRFMTVPGADGQQLNAWMIVPPDFDSTKKYPLLMFVYGGPGSQQVSNSYDPANGMWYQMLASKGYIVACVDGRGTGAKGSVFEKCTYLNLGKLETEDQIAAGRYFGKQKYVDASRIGIWGWSYGGYMTLLCMTKGADVFKTGISVAPVTTWRYYDTIYTERFLRTPQENAAGYDNNSPINFANMLKGNLLLVHGTGDDNVHYQNSLEMVNSLVRANKQFTQFFYPNRNHGISGGNTRLHLYRMMTDFIIEKL